MTNHYIGRNDCKKATCTNKQEFPESESEYCMMHALEEWKRT